MGWEHYKMVDLTAFNDDVEITRDLLSDNTYDLYKKHEEVIRLIFECPLCRFTVYADNETRELPCCQNVVCLYCFEAFDGESEDPCVYCGFDNYE